MSGIVGSKLNIRGSGRVAKLGTDGQVLTSAGAGQPCAFEDLAAGTSWQSVTTGSTLAAEAGNGYPIDTTSNACTITLPASASVGDEIIFTDYARTWGTNGITIDSNGLNYQGEADTWTVEYDTDGISLSITYMDATNGWIPTLDKAVTDEPVYKVGNTEGIFGFGGNAVLFGMTNKISSSGVAASDVAAVGTARTGTAGTEYGDDKGIFFGGHDGSNYVAYTNLVSDAGVVQSDTAAVAGVTARQAPGGCGYDIDKAIVMGGTTGSYTNVSNLISNAGVVASDQAATTGTARGWLGACEYGSDKGIVGYGNTGSKVSMTNLISNAGVVATDTTGVGTVRGNLAACGYGYDKGIFGFGKNGGYYSLTNLVSNTGVVGSDVAGVGTAIGSLGACEYGSDKGIFGFGYPLSAVTNLVSNTGVIAGDTAGVGTARGYVGACSFN